MSANNLKYCLYARKSMDAEERQAMSIESQLSEMQAIAKRDHLSVIEIKTEAHSAKDSGERAVFNEIITAIRAGIYNAILTWAPDRLSRNAGDLGRLVDLMDQELLLEIRTYMQVFTNSPNDKFLMMILGSQAKLENDNKGENVKRGLRMKCELGYRPGVPPIGYTSDKYGQKGQKQITVDPMRADTIKQMFEKVAHEHWSGHDVYHWLRDIGLKTRGDKFLSLSNVYRILRCTFYYGSFEYPEKSGNWYIGKHTPLIERTLFDQVQERLGLLELKKRYNKSKITSYKFTRLMHCGHCGSGITATERYKPLINGDVAHYIYYFCSRGKDRRCKAPRINEEGLIVQLTALLGQVDLDDIGTRDILETELEKWYDFESFVTGEATLERSLERQEIDLRKYAKRVFTVGTTEEKRNILGNLKSRLILKDGRVMVDQQRNATQLLT